MNRAPKPKRRLHTAGLAMMFVGTLIGVAFAAQQYMETDTSISATPGPRVTKVLGVQDKTKEFAVGNVSLRLPNDWEVFKAPDVPAGATSWRNTVGNKGVRVITLYVDNIPAGLAVNRVLAVQGAEDRMLPMSSVSENCTNFVDGGRGAGSGQAPARWDGVRFICDTGNFVRNVVGTSSPDGVNTVRLTGKTGGSHQLFLTYTDADATPNHQIFTAAVESLRMN
jgi:hypothetical protein